MKVYLVIEHWDYEADEVKSAWATREAAEAEADRLSDPNTHRQTFFIREMEVRSDN